MSWETMFFMTGLLTLLALSSVRGDHHIKGGGHIKGGDHVKGGSESIQQPVLQEEIVPAPGFHASIKTSEPSIKTHSPSNAVIAAITKKGSSSNLAAVNTGKTSFSLADAQIRDPAAFPVIVSPIREPTAAPVVQPAVKTVRRKTIRRKTKIPGARIPNESNKASLVSVKTSSRDVTESLLLDSKRVAPQPVSKSSTIKTTTHFTEAKNPYITIDGQDHDAGKEVIILEDGSIVEAGDTSRQLGRVSPTSGPALKVPNKQQAFNQDVRYVRGPQIPQSTISSSDNRKTVDFTSQVISQDHKTDVGASDGSIVIPGGPRGSSITLTQTEVQNVLNSGGIIEFPEDSATNPKDVSFARTDIRKTIQATAPRRPASRITSNIDKTKTGFRSQTVSTSANRGTQTSVISSGGNKVLVPGGPGGSSVSLTEHEIQNILNSGGVLEFPSDSAVTAFGARDVTLNQRKPSTNSRTTLTRTNVQTTALRKPTSGVTSNVNSKRTDFKSQTSTDFSSTSGGQILVSGGPGGSSISLTETEIQNILNTGGIIEFPDDSTKSVNVLGAPITPKEPSTNSGALFRRTNLKKVTQTNIPQKPATKITNVSNARNTYKSQISSTRTITQPSGASQMLIPGGPGGSSISLTDSEIQSILNSGGVIEFPTDSDATLSAKSTFFTENKPAVSKVATLTKSNVEQRREDLKSRTLNSEIRTEGNKILVSGGPGGSSISLTQTEIQNILNSGGVLEFPVDSITNSAGARDAAFTQRKPSSNSAATLTRTNVQSVTGPTSPRKPASAFTSNLNRKRTEFKSQTVSTTSTNRGAQISGSRSGSNKISVSGGPGGSSLSLTESEIQSILNSGGVVEFPSDSVTTSSDAKAIINTQRTPIVNRGAQLTRTNVQTVAQTTAPRKPTGGIISNSDRKRTEFKSQTSSTGSSSRIPQGSGLLQNKDKILVSGGPGGSAISLSEAEIQNILNSGGYIEFDTTSTGGEVAQRGQVYQEAVLKRTNLQTARQTTVPKRPTTGITSNVQKTITDFKSTTTLDDISSQALGIGSSGGQILVPGGPGGSSISLSETEIQNILNSGGFVEFPVDSRTGSAGEKAFTQRRPSPNRGATLTRTNAQAVSQTTSLRKPSAGLTSNIDRKRTEFKTQTSSTTSANRGPQILGVRPGDNKVSVPGGPGGSISLTESEIQNILNSGGFVEFPTDSAITSSGARDATHNQRSTAVNRRTTITRSNVQALNSRKPTAEVRPVSNTNEKRDDFKSQTFSAGSGSILVPGGPGGSSISLTEAEIQNILNSGGVVEFPSHTESADSGFTYRLPSNMLSELKNTEKSSKVTQEEVQAAIPDSSSFEQAQLSQLNEPISGFHPVEPVRFQPSLPFSETSVPRISLNTDKNPQLQVKVDDIVEQSPVANNPAISQIQLANESTQTQLSLEDLDTRQYSGKSPAQITSYISPSAYRAPSNYRLPLAQSSNINKVPVIPEQQKLEQILL